MQLIELNLLSSFRGLPKGFKIIFPENKSSLFEPICLVGLNGSGKSNVLEVLAEIFFYLENCFRESIYSEKHIKSYSSSWGFNLKYNIPKTVVISQIQDRQEVWDFVQSSEDEIRVEINKGSNEFPTFNISSNERTLQLARYHFPYISSFLPSRVVGYSSGMNELLSNSFIKMDFRYVEDFVKNIQKNQTIQDSMNRMFFMNYDSNKYITVSNFLFDKEHFNLDRFNNKTTNTSEFGSINLSDIKKETGVEDVFEFSISITLEKNAGQENDKSNYLPHELDIALRKLKSCSTFYQEKEISVGKNKLRKNINYDYWVNSETKRAFQDQFGTASELYKSLYYLQLLNNRLVSKNTRNKILNSPTGTLENLSDEIPRFEKDKLSFRLYNLKLKKKNNHIVEYRKLSDGEHQLLQVMGSLLLMDDSGTLFLFDEPETHFNPEWRSKFVKLTNSSISQDRKQQLILTTHSPFIISDSKQENVFLFKRNTDGMVKEPNNPNFNTFGASVSKITKELFNKEESLAELALDLIEEIKKMPMTSSEQIQKAKEASRALGDSPEKILLFREFLIREEGLKKDA